MRVHGVIDATLVRGRIVYRNGTVTGEPGWGRQATPGAVTPRALESQRS